MTRDLYKHPFILFPSLNPVVKLQHSVRIYNQFNVRLETVKYKVGNIGNFLHTQLDGKIECGQKLCSLFGPPSVSHISGIGTPINYTFLERARKVT